MRRGCAAAVEDHRKGICHDGNRSASTHKVEREIRARSAQVLNGSAHIVMLVPGAVMEARPLPFGKKRTAGYVRAIVIPVGEIEIKCESRPWPDGPRSQKRNRKICRRP